MDLVSTTCYMAVLVTAVLGMGDKFYTLTNVTSWEEANRTCTLATPRIHYTRQGFILDFGDGLNGVGQYWVGYTTYNHIFQYIGCIDEAYVTRLATGYFTIPSPRQGVCYSACGTDVFGVRDRHCYCIPNRLNRDYDKQTCTRSCTHTGIQCGGESAVSIFEVADPTMFNFTRSSKNTEYCIAYDVRKQAFIWEDCDRTSRLALCKPSLGHKLMTSSGGKRRRDTADDCILRRNTNTLPLDDDNADFYWTGYFRTDDCIRTFKDHGTPVHYGHVNIRDKKLRFGPDKTEFDAMCDGKPASTRLTTALENIVSTPGKQTSTMLTTTEESTISTPGVPASTLLTTTEISIATTPGKLDSAVFTTTDMESTASTQESDNELLPIKIGVPLLISVCVIVVVAGVMCNKKRQTGSQTQQQTHQQPAINITPTEAELDETHTYTELNVQSETPDSTYSTAPEAGMNETHTYTEINVQSETPDYMNVQSETPDSTFFTAPEAGMNETHTYTELNVQSETPDYMNVQSETPDYMNVQSETPDSTYFTAPEAGMNETHTYTGLNVQSETPDYMNV